MRNTPGRTLRSRGDAGPDHSAVIHDVKIMQCLKKRCTMNNAALQHPQSSFAYLLDPWAATSSAESGIYTPGINQGQALSSAPPPFDVSLTRSRGSRPQQPFP
ncbi:hypothetical protein N7512_006843 [Penicillium capsulatum]|nr:hypothetical protein N7512_006843 [Penicillium capsulatum]